MDKLLNIKINWCILIKCFICNFRIWKIVGYKGTVNSFKSVFWMKNLPAIFYQFTILMVIVLLLVGPGVIMYSFYDHSYSLYAKYACYALAGFTALATLLYHMPVDSNQKNHMLKNISIIGGFLILSEVC